MVYWILRLGFSLFILCFTKPTAGRTDSWHMQDQCGRSLEAYGGTLHFDATKLRKGFCQVKIVGLGDIDTMLSIFFTSFNITDNACMENITMEEPGMENVYRTPYSTNGLFQSFCKDTGYMNANSMYTTDHNSLLLKYSSNQKLAAMDMQFTIKFTAFTSRFKGCREDELTNDMFSCPTGRCVHSSLLCADLNPCGDNKDCNITGGVTLHQGEEKGLHYVKFVVITVVTVFAMFVLIQITLIVRNEHNMCLRKPHSSTRHIEAELMPMTNGHSVIEVQKS